MNRVAFCALIALGVAIDQGSKFMVEANLALGEEFALLPNLSLLRARNEGIAFSLFSSVDVRVLLAATLAGLLALGWVWSRSGRRGILWDGGFALIFAGALGNLLDRAIHGHVTDFVLLHAAGWRFAIFNGADCFITLGVCMIAADELRLGLRSARERKEDAGK